jgi:hypothetical protein
VLALVLIVLRLIADTAATTNTHYDTWGKHFKREISGSHGGDYEDDSFLVYRT